MQATLNLQLGKSEAYMVIGQWEAAKAGLNVLR